MVQAPSLVVYSYANDLFAGHAQRAAGNNPSVLEESIASFLLGLLTRFHGSRALDSYDLDLAGREAMFLRDHQEG